MVYEKGQRKRHRPEKFIEGNAALFTTSQKKECMRPCLKHIDKWIRACLNRLLMFERKKPLPLPQVGQPYEFLHYEALY